jgi:DNA-binding CsgD family transcriptional regulator
VPKEINSSFFNSALQYNQQNRQKIKYICEPLNNVFNISYFGYVRTFDDGSYLIVSNSPTYLESVACYDYSFNSSYFKSTPKQLSKYESHRLIWPQGVRDGLIEKLQTQNIYNCFNITKENNGTLEVYFFGTDKDYPLINDLYKNNFFILEEFISYFHKIGQDLCDPSDITKQGISPYLRKHYPQIMNIFELSTPWEQEIIHFNSLLNTKLQEEIHSIAKRNSLSPRELQCLMQLSIGKTAKEIALILNISPRTVETHIDKVRFKTTCNTQKEIIQWFEMNFGYFLTDSTSRAQLITSIENGYYKGKK